MPFYTSRRRSTMRAADRPVAAIFHSSTVPNVVSVSSVALAGRRLTQTVGPPPLSLLLMRCLLTVYTMRMTDRVTLYVIESTSQFGGRMQKLLARVMADPRYITNTEYGRPRSGHPEGTVKAHIAELEANLEALKPRIADAQTYWKLKFLIHVHDTFKADATRDVPILDPCSHASLAKAFAAELTDNPDLLNIIQFHDENYALWRQVAQSGSYDPQRFATLLEAIQDWDLFLLFLIVDGCTKGKERSKLAWFMKEVKQYKHTVVDESWILPPLSDSATGRASRP
jgi:hypothetical protein